jgi:hypothetical protein
MQKRGKETGLAAVDNKQQGTLHCVIATTFCHQQHIRHVPMHMCAPVHCRQELEGAKTAAQSSRQQADSRVHQLEADINRWAGAGRQGRFS